MNKILLLLLRKWWNPISIKRIERTSCFTIPVSDKNIIKDAQQKVYYIRDFEDFMKTLKICISFQN